MKPCLIRQPAGLGDVLFTQKIAKLLLSQGRCNSVVWPLVSQYDYIEPYIGTPGIKYVNENADFEFKELYNSHINTLHETEDVLYVPLQYADQTTTLPDPRAHGHIKYKFCNNLQHSDWKNYLTLNRDLTREKLLVDKLGIDLDSKYNLINKNYGSPPGNLSRDDIVPSNDYPNVYMEFFDNVHLFDWLTVAEHACEIHTMETSLCYMLEKLDIKDVYVYSKYMSSGDDFGYIRGNYDTTWIYIS